MCEGVRKREKEKGNEPRDGAANRRTGEGNQMRVRENTCVCV